MGDMNRDFFYEKSLACGTTVDTATAFAFGDFSGMFVQIPTGSPVTQFHVYVSGEENGEYTLGIDENDNNMEKLVVIAARAYRVNPSVFPALWVKILTDQAAGVLNVFGKA